MKPCTHVVARSSLLPVLVSAMTLVAVPVSAAPDEIRVMTDDLTNRGDVSLEIHAASVRARTGATARHLGQGLAELSYGLSETWEASVQLPVSREPGWRSNGANLELQYVAPHDLETGPYWGARLEIGRARAPLEPQMTSSLELRPIFGYRGNRWHAALNAALRAPLSGGAHKTTFEPAAKLAREVAAQTQLGVEYYSQGAQRPEGADAVLARRKLALVVVDTRVRAVGLSFGLGRGIGAAADGPVVKFIAGLEL